MTDLTIIKQNGGAYIDSREVADLIGKPHNDLMKAIRVYCGYLNAGRISLVDFFIESTYSDAKGENRPCYLLSKMGCEMVANKLTGEKGVLFTAAYVKRFNELEAAERVELEARAAMPAPRLGEYNACARIVIRALEELGAIPEEIVLFLQELYKPLGISIAADTVIVVDGESASQAPRYYTAKQIAEMLGVYSLAGNPHSQAVSCILNDVLFIGDEHKTAVTVDCGDHIGLSIRYDDHAVQSVKEWVIGNGFPDEVYGFGRTYSVRYC